MLQAKIFSTTLRFRLYNLFVFFPNLLFNLNKTFNCKSLEIEKAMSIFYDVKFMIGLTMCINVCLKMRLFKSTSTVEFSTKDYLLFKINKKQQK